MNDNHVDQEAEWEENNHLCKFDTVGKKQSKLLRQEEYITSLKEE